MSKRHVPPLSTNVRNWAAQYANHFGSYSRLLSRLVLKKSEQYGDENIWRHPLALVRKIEQELLDVGGWMEILLTSTIQRHPNVYQNIYPQCAEILGDAMELFQKVRVLRAMLMQMTRDGFDGMHPKKGRVAKPDSRIIM